MWKALTTVTNLPDETKMYFGHEYTVSNLKFALHVEPDNTDIQNKMEWAKKVGCTTPSTLANEKLTNPFFRVELATVVDKVMGPGTKAPAEEVLGKLRKMKDNFK